MDSVSCFLFLVSPLLLETPQADLDYFTVSYSRPAPIHPYLHKTETMGINPRVYLTLIHHEECRGCIRHRIHDPLAVQEQLEDQI